MMNFQPDVTPHGERVSTTFIVRDRAYVVDRNGTLFFIDSRDDNPDMWCWIVVQEL